MSATTVGRERALVVGVDFGTLSGRAIVVRAADGAELASAVHPFRHGVMDRHLTRTGQLLPPDWALQVPSDYVEVLRTAVPAALAAADADPADVVGIATDFTASTVLPTTAEGVPLCQLPEFAANPHAYAKLWKHHAAQPQADRINELAAARAAPWLSRYGGRTSSEWQFPKALQVLEDAPELYRAMDRWVEAADWIVWQLCGRYVRSVCAAGYKGLLQDGAHPDPEFLGQLHPDFADFVAAKLDQPLGRLGARAGALTPQAAAWTGLRPGIAVAVGNVDAHVTAAAAGAVGPGQLVATMGTSTCLVMSAERRVEVPGMCGIVDGGIVDGLWGYEAGQSGVGDIFSWFVDTCVPAGHVEQARQRGMSVHELLTEFAAAQPVGAHGLVALDWHSGNRSVLTDHTLSGLVVGATLATRPEDVYRALLEATAFGTRTIVDAFVDAGLPVTELVAAGGLTTNRFFMQMCADVTGLPIGVITSAQGPALGSAIHAAVAAGIHPDVPTAAGVMGRHEPRRYLPDPGAAPVYDALFAEYARLHDYFGRGGNAVMHRLRAIRRAALDAPGAGAAVPPSPQEARP
ncbi:ribulokinase [Plantactinospora sp. KBS50]|uniref:ribulokinase n=1 Tax=Plantactinospora sp. KBS50 TaxID=2024580 RepID=UPI0018E03A50|nr:ribulokinase [Plantactinospora sp. KBS50]